MDSENRSWEVPQHGNVYYKDVSRVSLCEKASDARGAEEKPGESSLSGMLEKEKERINTIHLTALYAAWLAYSDVVALRRDSLGLLVT